MLQKLELGFLVISLIQIISLLMTKLDTPISLGLRLLAPVMCFSSALGFALVYRASLRFTRQAAVPWFFISLSIISLASGDILNTLHHNGLLAWVLQNVLFNIFFLIGILNFPSPKSTRAEFFQNLADFLIIVLAVGLVYWFFLLMPLFSAHLPARSPVLPLTLLNPVLNISILWVLARIPYRNFENEKYASPKVFLVIGFYLYFVTNAIGSFQNLVGGINTFQINFTALIEILLGMAGFEQARQISLQSETGHPDLLASIPQAEISSSPPPSSPRQLEFQAMANENLISAYTVMNPYLRDIILYVCVSDGRILAANPAAELEYGYSNEEMLLQRISDLRSPDTLGEVDEQMKQANLAGILFETRHRRKDGSIFPAEVRSAKGDYLGQNCNISIIRNISERENASLALRTAYHQFERTFATLEDLIFVRSAYAPNIVLVNAASQRMLGYSPEELIGNSAEVLFASKDDFEYIDQTFEKSIGLTGRFRIETRVKTRDGQVLLAEVTFNEILNDSKQRIGVVGIIHDITQRRRAEIRNFKSESRYKALFKNMNESLVLLEYKTIGREYPRLYFLEANQTFFQQMEFTSEQAEGQDLGKIMPGNEAQWTELGQRIAVRGESFIFLEYTSPLEKTFLINAFSLEGMIIGLLLMDVTQQRKAEKELKHSADRYQTVSRRLLNVQEEERRHLGRELHDEIGQVLTGLKFTIEAGLDMMPPPGKKSALASMKIINDLIVQVRELSRRLRPALLDDFGLVPALTSLCERLGQFSELVINFEHTTMETRLPLEIETGAYRIVQEALTNIIRHSGANWTTIKITVENDQLLISIDDNGKGFDVPAVLATTQSVGLTGLFERASLLNGLLTIDSIPGLGTHIFVRLPLEKKVVEALK